MIIYLQLVSLVCQRNQFRAVNSPCNGDLSTGITKLSESRVKEAILLPKGLIIRVGMCLGGLEFHICIGYLGDHRQEEGNPEDEDEDGDGNIDPLDIPQRIFITKGEEHIRTQDGGDHGADAIEGLRDVDSELGVLGRPADYMGL